MGKAGLALSILLLSTVPSAPAEEPGNSLGVTLGGQHLFYDIQATHVFDKRYALVIAFSYLPVFKGQTQAGFQFDLSPFESAFAFSTGLAAWKLESEDPTLVPDLGCAYTFGKEGDWALKIRPTVFYQSHKEFFWPWIGFTLSRRIP